MENEMCFPETWEEFRKQYRIVDTEKVYTNGAEMIPTFRVKQWLDHMESVKRSQQSEQNKMTYIALLFGKKLGEEFIVKKNEYKVKVKITQDGLAYAQPITREFDDELLAQMIKGSAEIVETIE